MILATVATPTTAPAQPGKGAPSVGGELFALSMGMVAPVSAGIGEGILPDIGNRQAAAVAGAPLPVADAETVDPALAWLSAVDITLPPTLDIPASPATIATPVVERATVPLAVPVAGEDTPQLAEPAATPVVTETAVATPRPDGRRSRSLPSRAEPIAAPSRQIEPENTRPAPIDDEGPASAEDDDAPPQPTIAIDVRPDAATVAAVAPPVPENAPVPANASGRRQNATSPATAPLAGFPDVTRNSANGTTEPQPMPVSTDASPTPEPTAGKAAFVVPQGQAPAVAGRPDRSRPVTEPVSASLSGSITTAATGTPPVAGASNRDRSTDAPPATEATVRPIAARPLPDTARAAVTPDTMPIDRAPTRGTRQPERAPTVEVAATVAIASPASGTPSPSMTRVSPQADIGPQIAPVAMATPMDVPRTNGAPRIAPVDTAAVAAPAPAVVATPSAPANTDRPLQPAAARRAASPVIAAVAPVPVAGGIAVDTPSVTSVPTSPAPLTEIATIPVAGAVAVDTSPVTPVQTPPALPAAVRPSRSALPVMAMPAPVPTADTPAIETPPVIPAQIAAVAPTVVGTPRPGRPLAATSRPIPAAETAVIDAPTPVPAQVAIDTPSVVAPRLVRSTVATPATPASATDAPANVATTPVRADAPRIAEAARPARPADAPPVAAAAAPVTPVAAQPAIVAPTQPDTTPRRSAFVREVIGTARQTVALRPQAAMSQQPGAGVTAPAAQVFGAAMHAASGAEDRKRIDTVEATPNAVASPIELRAVAPVTNGDQPTLDMRQDAWPSTMIAHIEQLRDAANANDTRIRLVPDALGAIDVAVQRVGDALHVRFTAEQEATRALIEDAQPRLSAIAEERGIRIDRTLIETAPAAAAQSASGQSTTGQSGNQPQGQAGSTNPQAGQQQAGQAQTGQQQQQRQQPSTTARQPASPARAPSRDTDAATDGRVA